MALSIVALALLAAPPASALPPGFSERVVFSGLDHPTALAFSPDGRVFVAEKSGLIKVFDGLTDTTPTRFADLRTNVHNFWDRGLLGLALDPQFPTRPYVYVAYTYDAPPGGTAPRWSSPGATTDGCPSPPGATTDGCVVTGRVSRLQAAGNQMTGSEQVLIHDWCQQFPSHSVGDVVFGPDGALYVAARCARRTCARAAIPSPSTAPSSASPRTPGRGCRAIRWPARPTRTRGASSPWACATPSASRCARGRTRSG